MVGIDTSVLLRLFLKDDAEQLAQTRDMVARVEAAGDTLYVPQAVLCELVWVLALKAGFKREAIAEAIRGLVETEVIELEGQDTVCAALERHVTSRTGFADCLIVENALAAGVARFVTFDRALLQADDCLAPAEV